MLVATASVALLPAPGGAARLETIAGPPEMTVRVPAGWRLVESSGAVGLVRGDRKLRLELCGLSRRERDMTGRRAAARERKLRRILPGTRSGTTVPAAGGGCLTVRGRGAARIARRLRPRLGPWVPPAASSTHAEQLARAARRRTLDMPRAQGSGYGLELGGLRARTDVTWAWDLPAGYIGLAQTTTGDFLPDDRVERVHSGPEVFIRYGDGCWRRSHPLDGDNILEPRGELRERDVPPSSRTAWRISYAPPEQLPDGSTRVRWNGFVAGGEAIITSDGLLRFVRIFDHGQASGFSGFDVIEVEFAAFPVDIPRRQVGRICPSP